MVVPTFGGAVRGRRALAPVGLMLVGLVGAVLTGCGSSGGTTGAPAPTGSACPTPLTTTPAGSEQTLVTKQGPRTYDIWLPKGYTGSSAVPVVLDLHGAGEQSLDYATKVSGMAREAPARGYLVVAPQGGRPGGSPIWSYPGYGTDHDEVAFVDELLASLSSKYCVDPKRVYASGISQGAGLSHYLSCRTTRFAAVAPIAGVSLVLPCAALPPEPIIAFHGTNDGTVPYEGDPNVTVPPPANQAYLGDVQAVMAEWALRNGCTTKYVDTPVSARSVRRTYEGCPPGEDVQLYISKGTGHTYPGGPAIPAATASALGGQTQEIDAAKLILDFFDAHVQP